MIKIREIFSLRALNSQAKSYSSKEIVLACLSLIIPLIITYIGWQVGRVDDEDDAKVSLDFKIQETNQKIIKRMLAYEQVLLGGIGLLAASDTVTREEWKIYVENLLISKNFPGILGIGYSYKFAHSDSLKVVKAMQNEGFVNFRIWPEGVRDEYTSVIYIEPFNERNQRAFGYDLLSEPMRQSAMMEAKNTGQTTITGKIKFVQETEYNIQAGFIIFIPFYNKNIQPVSLDERKNLFRGYVYSPFRMRNLIGATLGNDLQDINLQIFDGLDTIPQNLMYTSDSLRLGSPEESFIRTSRLELYGKTWTMKYFALPAFIASYKSEKPLIVLLSGILISLLFFLVTLSFLNSRKTSKKLSEVLESTGEGIFGLDNNMKCTFINKSALQMLGVRLNECINHDIGKFIHTKNTDDRMLSGSESPVVAFIKNKTNNVSEHVFYRKDGSHFYAEYSSHPIIEDGVETGFVVTFNDISERKKASDQIEGSLREKEVLLREIHHRVKNNLQIISSLLNLQAGFSADRRTNEILEESKNRVKSMALIHEKLYQSKNFSSLEINEFIEELVKNLFNSYGYDSETVKTELSFDNLNLNADQAVYLGLIVNELLSNSLKHAFNLYQSDLEHKIPPRIFLSLRKDTGGYYSIIIRDNGRGLPVDLDFRNTESLGLQLVMSLVKQLDGEISLNSDSGTEFQIKFKGS